MKVTRCDRCGAIFTELTTITLRRYKIENPCIRIFGNDQRYRDFDLCQDCLDEFAILLKGKDLENA